MSAPYVVRWGILAPGGIAETFTKDLLVDPRTRDVVEVKHTVVAVASSSSEQRARDFVSRCGCPSSTKAYGSYDALVKDTDVEIVYVASPHSHHFEQALLCLNAGKHVLCEKPLTWTASQAKQLVEKAKEKGLFLMQALWTRYTPPSLYVSEVIRSGRVGTIYRVISDTSLAMDPDKEFADGTNRMVNPDLAGGALLDLGIYSLSWAFYAVQCAGVDIGTTKLVSAIKPYKTGVDETTTMILSFPRPADKGGDLHAVVMASMRVSMEPDGGTAVGPCVRIQGDKGEVQVFPPSYRPSKVRVVTSEGESKVEDKEWKFPGPGEGSGWYNGFDGVNAEGEGHGMFWEADEAGLALKEGRKESNLESLKEVVKIMEIIDEVQAQNK